VYKVQLPLGMSGNPVNTFQLLVVQKSFQIQVITSTNAMMNFHSFIDEKKATETYLKP
jgi:hypothetical protein